MPILFILWINYLGRPTFKSNEYSDVLIEILRIFSWSSGSMFTLNIVRPQKSGFATSTSYVASDFCSFSTRVCTSGNRNDFSHIPHVLMIWTLPVPLFATIDFVNPLLLITAPTGLYNKPPRCDVRETREFITGKRKYSLRPNVGIKRNAEIALILPRYGFRRAERNRRGCSNITRYTCTVRSPPYSCTRAIGRGRVRTAAGADKRHVVVLFIVVTINNSRRIRGRELGQVNAAQKLNSHLIDEIGTPL